MNRFFTEIDRVDVSLTVLDQMKSLKENNRKTTAYSIEYRAKKVCQCDLAIVSREKVIYYNDARRTSLVGLSSSYEQVCSDFLHE